MSTHVWNPLPPAPKLVRSNAYKVASSTILPSYLEKIANGYKHIHKNIYLRTTSGSNIDPILKAANTWLKVNDLKQDWIAQLDEVWNTFEDKIKSAKTDLEIYSIFQKIPKSSIKYKDLCNNNVAHRLILALNNFSAEIVDGVWYLLDEIIQPYMNTVNDFGHTPWEVMGSVPIAFEKILAKQGIEILNLIPIRTWRKHQVYLNAWTMTSKEKRISFAKNFKHNNLDMLCYLSQNTPEDIYEFVSGNTILLEGYNENIRQTYPLQSEFLLLNLAELTCNY